MTDDDVARWEKLIQSYEENLRILENAGGSASVTAEQIRTRINELREKIGADPG